MGGTILSGLRPSRPAEGGTAMSRARNPGLKKRFRANGTFEWHIDKRIKGVGRLRESTRTCDKEEAARYLARQIEEIRQAAMYGTRHRRRFREATTRYLNEFAC